MSSRLIYAYFTPSLFWLFGILGILFLISTSLATRGRERRSFAGASAFFSGAVSFVVVSFVPVLAGAVFVVAAAMLSLLYSLMSNVSGFSSTWMHSTISPVSVRIALPSWNVRSFLNSPHFGSWVVFI